MASSIPIIRTPPPNRRKNYRPYRDVRDIPVQTSHVRSSSDFSACDEKRARFKQTHFREPVDAQPCKIPDSPRPSPTVAVQLVATEQLYLVKHDITEPLSTLRYYLHTACGIPINIQELSFVRGGTEVALTNNALSLINYGFSRNDRILLRVNTSLKYRGVDSREFVRIYFTLPEPFNEKRFSVWVCLTEQSFLSLIDEVCRKLLATCPTAIPVITAQNPIILDGEDIRARGDFDRFALLHSINGIEAECTLNFT